MEENLMPTKAESGKKVKMYRKKRVLLPILFLLIAIVLVVGYWFLYLRGFVSTDDAFVDGNQVDLSSRILGRINRLTVDEGDTVKEGELLVQLDDSDLRAQEAQEKENIKYNQQNVSLAEVSLKRAQDDFRRTAGLFRDSVATSEQFDHAQKTLDMAQAQYKIALAQVSTSKAKLNVVQIQLQNSKILAPMKGVVAKKWVMPGDVIQPGQPILTIYDLENLWVTANFEETKLASIRLNDKALISVDAYPGIPYEGKVILIGAVTSSQFSLIPPNNASGNFTKVTQRVPVKISIETLQHPEGKYDPAKLLPGMSVQVKIRIKGNKS
jgi:membrane fusion protein (multidrug efflux system)